MFNRLTVRMVELILNMYKYGVSPILGERCIYEPTCSEYFKDAVRKNGLIKGSVKGMKRILRCNPFSKGGFDPP